MINKDYLKSLERCENYYANYLEYYGDLNLSLEEFLDLSKLTHSEKKWVFFRSIPSNKLCLVAADFAERVLHIFESKYPNDDRPRKAIEAARSPDATIHAVTNVARDAAAAGRSTYDPDASYSASAAYSAACANVADATINAVSNASVYAADAATSRKDEEKAQIEIMKKYAKELKGEDNG